MKPGTSVSFRSQDCAACRNRRTWMGRARAMAGTVQKHVTFAISSFCPTLLPRSIEKLGRVVIRRTVVAL